MQQEIEPVPRSAPIFSLSIRVAVKVALPRRRIFYMCHIKLGCQGEKGDTRTRGWLSTLPFEALADVSSSTRGLHVPGPPFKDVTRRGKCAPPTYLYRSQVIRSRHDVLGQGGDPLYLAVPLRRRGRRRTGRWREQRT